MRKKIITMLLAVTMMLSATFAPALSANAADGTWMSGENGWWYCHVDGSYTTNGWEYIDGQWYLFDDAGWMLTGWQYVGGAWYYMYGSGAMAADTWIEGYYLTGSGAMATDAGTSQQQTTGWILSGDSWWYCHADGSYTTNGWEYIDGQWYLFDGAGWMLTGWQYVGGAWYYMYGSGAMAADTWIGNYYVTSSGAMATNTWIGEYYVGADGAWVSDSQSGSWLLSGNRWWYRHADGSYTTNGWEYIDGQWYLFDSAGWMLRGWQEVNGTWYYLDASGALVTNAYIDGKYYVDPSGAWIQDTQTQTYTIDLGNGQTTTVEGYFDDASAARVIELLNEYRVSQGIAPLQVDNTLMEAAKVRGYETTYLFDHVRPNGEMCWTVSEAIFGENIAAGYTSPEDVMEGWKNSQGHNENMLDTDYNTIGVSLFIATPESDTSGYRYYWVQLFGL